LFFGKGTGFKAYFVNVPPVFGVVAFASEGIYFSFDSVPPVENGGGSAGTFVIIVIAVVVIGVIAFVIYNKKQKKIQAEIIEKNKIKEALAEKTAKEDTTSAE
jgi:cbb3-type cytochrome oxidase subunit 3